MYFSLFFSWFCINRAPKPIVAAFSSHNCTEIWQKWKTWKLEKTGGSDRPDEDRLISAETWRLQQDEYRTGTGGHLRTCQPCLQSGFDQETMLSSRSQGDTWTDSPPIPRHAAVSAAAAVFRRLRLWLIIYSATHVSAVPLRWMDLIFDRRDCSFAQMHFLGLISSSLRDKKKQVKAYNCHLGASDASHASNNFQESFIFLISITWVQVFSLHLVPHLLSHHLCFVSCHPLTVLTPISSGLWRPADDLYPTRAVEDWALRRAYFISIFATREPMRWDSPKVRSGLSGIYGAAILSQIDVIDLVLPAFDGHDWNAELFSFANYRWESKCGGQREPVGSRGGIHPQNVWNKTCLLIMKIYEGVC